MTALLALLRPLLPYLLTGALSIGIGAWATHKLDTAKYEAYQAQVEKEKANEQQAAADALQTQINVRLATEANNEKVIQQLQADRDSAVSDRDIANRLLAAAQARPANHPLPATADRPAAPDPASPQSDRPADALLGLTSGAVAECRDALQRLAALQIEVQSQLRTNP